MITNPQKIKVIGIKKKAAPSKLNAANLQIMTDNSENMKTEENIQNYLNQNSNWNMMEATNIYLSKNQLQQDSNESDPSRFVNFSKYMDVQQICLQDINDQRLDLLDYNHSLRKYESQRSNKSSLQRYRCDDDDENTIDLSLFTKKYNQELTQEQKDELKQHKNRRKRKIQIKNGKIESYFVDKKRSIYSFDPSLREEEKKKKEKLYRKPNFLDQVKKNLVNDENTIKFIKKNWFLFSQSVENPKEYMKGMQKVKNVYNELCSRIQKQQEENIKQDENLDKEEQTFALTNQDQMSPRFYCTNKKQDNSLDTIICMSQTQIPKKKFRKYKSRSNIPVKNLRIQSFSQNDNESSVDNSLNQTNSFNNQEHIVNKNGSFNKFNSFHNYYHQNHSLNRNNHFNKNISQNKITPQFYKYNIQIHNQDAEQVQNNYYMIEEDTIHSHQQETQSTRIERQFAQRHVKQNDDHLRHSQQNTNSSQSTRIFDSRTRITQESFRSSKPSLSLIFSSQKHKEEELNKNQCNLLQINTCILQKRQSSLQNSDRKKIKSIDNIFNFCRSSFREISTLNFINDVDIDQNDLNSKNQLPANIQHQQNSQLSHRSQLSQSTLKESSRGTSQSFDHPSSSIQNTYSFYKKKKHLNMNEIKVSTHTAKEQYLQKHNPFKYQCYVVPQTTKQLISKANKAGKYQYQKQIIPKNYGQFANIKRELSIS